MNSHDDDRYMRYAFIATIFTGLVGTILCARGVDRNDPFYDWAAGDTGGWCCSKPRRWCVPSTNCVDFSSDGRGGGFCRAFVAGEYCKDLCDEWRREPGGRGGSCRCDGGPCR
jgi:hypothetical protein